MKLRSRFLAVLTTAVLVAVAMTAPAFADDDDIRPSHVSVKPRTKTLTVGTTVSLEAIIRPDDANVYLDIEWDSSDSDVAYVDDDGTVTANAPGTCTIYARTGNRKSGSCEIYVPGKNAVNSPTTDANTSGNRDGNPVTDAALSSGDPELKTVALREHLERDTLLAAVNAAGGKAPVISNYATVSIESLQAVTGVSSAKVSFDTKSDQKTVGRVTVDPQAAKNLTGTLKIGVYSGTGNTEKIQKKFDKNFNNDTVVVRCDQSNFGMPVELAVRVGDMEADSIHLYRYNSTENKYSTLDASNLRVDSSGFAHFTTKIGGYIIISDGKLTAK